MGGQGNNAMQPIAARQICDNFQAILLCSLAVFLSDFGFVPGGRLSLGFSQTASRQCNLSAAQPVPALSIVMLIEWVGRREGGWVGEKQYDGSECGPRGVVPDG